MKTKFYPYQSILAITLGLLVGYYIYQYKILLVLSISIILISLLHHKIAFLIASIWEKIAFLIGLILPKILLAIVFFIILTPVAILSRMFKKVSRTDKDTNFISRNKIFTTKDFGQTW